MLTEVDLSFYTTKNIDMVLIMEDNFPEFATIFWEYIKEISTAEESEVRLQQMGIIVDIM